MQEIAVSKDLLLKDTIKQAAGLALESSTGAWKLGRSWAMLGR